MVCLDECTAKTARMSHFASLSEMFSAFENMSGLGFSGFVFSTERGGASTATLSAEWQPPLSVRERTLTDWIEWAARQVSYAHRGARVVGM